MNTNIGALADFASHKIEGYVMGEGLVSCPLFSQIDGNLWMGGCPVEVAPAEFDYIICLYSDGDYRVRGNQVVTRVHMQDAAAMLPEKLLHVLASHVVQCCDAGPTLVHCQAGLNRSGLITALALIKQGIKPGEAIEMLRRKRDKSVLCNKRFAQWLETQG